MLQCVQEFNKSSVLKFYYTHLSLFYSYEAIFLDFCQKKEEEKRISIKLLVLIQYKENKYSGVS